MALLRLWIKIILFISSFTPLLIILLIKSFSVQNFLVSFSWIGIIVVSNAILLISLIKTKKYRNPKIIKIVEKEDVTTAYFGYLIAYIFPFLQINYFNPFDLLGSIVLVLVIAFIYMNSNLFYINPMMKIFGYNLFKVTDNYRNVYMIITKRRKLLLNSTIKANSLSENIFIKVGDDD